MADTHGGEKEEGGGRVRLTRFSAPSGRDASHSDKYIHSFTQLSVFCRHGRIQRSKNPNGRPHSRPFTKTERERECTPRPDSREESSARGRYRVPSGSNTHAGGRDTRTRRPSPLVAGGNNKLARIDLSSGGPRGHPACPLLLWGGLPSPGRPGPQSAASKAAVRPTRISAAPDKQASVQPSAAARRGGT